MYRGPSLYMEVIAAKNNPQCRD